MAKEKKPLTLISISRKSFIQVTLLLLALLLLSVGLSYVLPKGEFGLLPDGGTDYLDYVRRDDLRGIPLWQGLLAPILVFFSPDGLTLLMLSLFLFVISAAFQVMNDVGGIQALIGAVSERFRDRRKLLLVLMSFLFYCFGSFLGLFEEMLTMLPIVAALCVLLGYDSFTGFRREPHGTYRLPDSDLCGDVRSAADLSLWLCAAFGEGSLFQPHRPP